jgi:glycyl-tRNA synthetase
MNPQILILIFISSGIAGLYDYGPPGSALQANIISEWRKHFIVEEGMLELDTTIMTPSPVFEASGHVARFADWMVKDTETGDVLRADHLVKNVLQARLNAYKEGVKIILPKVDKKSKEQEQEQQKQQKPIQLDEKIVKEYEFALTQASFISFARVIYPKLSASLKFLG